jgi:hypothetical protein
VEKWWKDWHFCKGFLRCLRHFFWKNVKQILKNEHVLTDFWGFWRDSWKNGERSPFFFWRISDGFILLMAKNPIGSGEYFLHCPIVVGYDMTPKFVGEIWWNPKFLVTFCQICVANFPHLVVQFLTVRLLHPAIPSGTRWEISWRRTNIWPRELGELRGWQLSGWSLVPI